MASIPNHLSAIRPTGGASLAGPLPGKVRLMLKNDPAPYELELVWNWMQPESIETGFVIMHYARSASRRRPAPFSARCKMDTG